MNFEDEYKWMVGAYYGVRKMDSYDLKEYILKDIENYIRNFIKETGTKDYPYKEKAREIEEKTSFEVMLQDAQIMLVRINGPMDLSFMIREKLRELKNIKK